MQSHGVHGHGKPTAYVVTTHGHGHHHGKHKKHKKFKKYKHKKFKMKKFF